MAVCRTLYHKAIANEQTVDVKMYSVFPTLTQLSKQQLSSVIEHFIQAGKWEVRNNSNSHSDCMYILAAHPLRSVKYIHAYFMKGKNKGDITIRFR